ncbi:VOC family protein [Enterovibrio nigricans]|uniref:Catechol 2,3-dioxygenase n=1 Tax=Enterovibrio nigricans DSM 22720 TaxID=1121868 RepID=A0A1T4V0P2_9GAMM|nr:VOC family protein [Enterovibrio nigricans]PKF49802.1 VOC family virulence protein [Enterovibrio nigricans]SKA58467.1 Catechol 2,3-dioxygenase [Enterovibrio nigricans DSM 22720]
MQISRLDHLVLTVNDIETSLSFYQRVMNMDVVSFGDGRKALQFGSQKINLHQRGREFKPNAQHAQTGSADLCFISETPLNDIEAHLVRQHVDIEEGPVQRTGAVGNIISLYFRDPDGNLIEVANYV